MTISIKTKFITLIGTPLGQSFAARMQNAAFKAAGLDYIYLYNEAGSTHLEQIIDGVRYMPAFCGAAVTKPNKVAVLDFLDDLDPLCKKTGSCNTVVKDSDGRLVGYNTDGLGFLKTMELDAGLDPQGKTFFCVGAGGVARTICMALAISGAHRIYVTDIIEDSAKQLVEDVNKGSVPLAEQVVYGDYQHVSSCDVVINASGVGMGTSMGTSPVPSECIHSGQFCFDACYNPRRTTFLLNAQDKGAKVMNGLYMSLYQGVRQFELWTGHAAPIEVMRNEIQVAIAELRG